MLRNLYPFSTIDGKVIPLDIIRPRGVMRIPFTSIATTLASMADETPVAVLRSTTACFVRFGEVAVLPSTDITLNQIYLASGDMVIVAPHSQEFSVISDGTDGDLIVQLLDRWAGLADESSYRT